VGTSSAPLRPCPVAACDPADVTTSLSASSAGPSNASPLPAEPANFVRRVEHLREIASELTPLAVVDLARAYPQVVTTASERRWDWVFYPAEDDPLVERGLLVMPPDVRGYVRDLDARGVQFDRLLIGHEVDKTALGRTDLSDRSAAVKLLAPKPETTPATPGVRRLRAVVAAAGTALRITGAGLAAVAVAPLALLDAADPVLIGVLTASGRALPGERAALFGIARWI
jgi:hypothetical protein